MIIQNFDLNLIPDSAPVVVHCDQYDHGTGRLVISLYEGSVPYSPSGTAVIQGVKPDGRGFDYSCTLNGNVVTADLTEQMSAVAGQVRTQIVVTESTGRTGTFVFILDVQKSALPDDTDMSESDYQYIEQAVEAAEQAVEDAQSSAEDSEAWAVGERGGVPVGPSDPTYQNNAEYWAYIASQYAQGGLTYKGSCLFANIPVSGMNHGDMWNIEDDFTTDSRFEEGAGIACAAGTNIAWNGSKWDVLAVAKSGVQSFNGRTGIVTPQSGDYDLDDLGDIVVTSATDGQVLTWDATSKKWVNRNASGGSTSLAGLDDVSLSSPTNGQVLKYNSTSQEWENANESGGGGLLPHFYIESESGSTVTVVAPDSSVITPTQMSSGHWECDVPSYGVYVVHSVLNGDDATVSVTVDDVKEYQINDAHYSFTLSVYAPVSSTVRVSATGESYVATGTGSTPVVFALHKASTAYSILVTLDGFSKSTQITTPAASGGSQSVTIEFGTINVTYENAFRGVSITCVQAAMTITKTAPSAGNTMTFYPPLTGQWTISGTVGGVPYSTTANVTSLSTPVSVNLETIPNGSTATPTDDIQKWLACAGIKDKAYTTLTQVLGDSETYNALLGDSNACAYMKRSTTWSTDICASQYAMNLLGQYDTACDALLSDSTWASAIANSTYAESVLNVKVPTMTSDTTPEGEVLFNTCEPHYHGYQAFKGISTGTSASELYTSDSTFAGYVSGTEWIGYKFTSPVKVSRVDYINSYYASNVKFYFEGKNDSDANWTRLSGELTAQNTVQWYSFPITNDSYFTQYRCLFISGQGANGGVNMPNVLEVQFYGRTTSSEKIHGGNPTYDSFYRIVDGNHVPVTDPSLLDAGTYTIYSNGLAKDPSNLSNDYGKTVRICPNTKEIVVRPDIAPYWFGYKNCNFIGTPYIPANGWDTCSGSVSEQNTYIQITCNFSSGAGMYALRTDRSFAFNGSQKLKAHIYDSSDTQYGNMDAKANISSNLAENGVSWTNDAVSETSALTAGSYYPYVAKRHGSSASSAKLDMLFIE